MTRRLLFCLLWVAIVAPAHTAEPIHYRFSFPEPQHRWMQVEATFPDLPRGTLELRMSRSSPGRYSLHDFAKNVYDVHAFGADGRERPTTRPDAYGWNVADPGGTVTVRYKVYGDRVDGTYLAVDTTHAHINMPAAIMWARGLDDRPSAITFTEPAGLRWQVATQLHGEGLEFTAPNLQYLMDSPAEFGPIAMRQVLVGGSRFRFALHHTGTDAEIDSYMRDVEKIVAQEGAIFGEFPRYEPGYYTFLADYLPYASGDGMEHRNSTVMTASASIAGARADLLDTVAHEFFHCWNVERIRPKGLEPFDFERANSSDELWLAEGFTQYYGPLVLQRARIIDLAETARTLTGLIEAVDGPPHLTRAADDASLMAPFTDGGRPLDRTNWSITTLSYYPFGGAIALALDLTLRERTDSRMSLDDYMRAMWRSYGKPDGVREGYVDHPYTMQDAERTLAEVSGDAAFARDFFARYIHGHEVADYSKLLARAGFSVRPRSPNRAWLGDVRFDTRRGPRLAGLVAPAWPIYAAGIDQDDELQQLDGQRISGESDVTAVLQRHKPGDKVSIVFVDRTGVAKTSSITLVADPHIEVVANGTTSDAQRSFRERWLGPKN